MATTRAASRACRTALLHHNLRLFGHLEAVVAGPVERPRAALGRDRVEGEERIGGDRREQLRREDLLAVILARERRDDVARNVTPVGAVAKAALHHVADQRLDPDDLAAFGALRKIDQRAT